METPVILQKKHFFFFEALFNQKAISSQIIFLASLPILLLLTTIGLCCVKITAYSIYLPLIAFAGSFACIFWRGSGLTAGYCLIGLLLICTFKHIPESEKLWQMGILFVLAVDYFILILSLDEIEDLLQQSTNESAQRSQEILGLKGHIENMQAEQQEKVETLQKNILQLDQGLHQNVLEKKQLQESIEWVQSEIEMLTSQKERFITEAREANQALLDANHQMGELKTTFIQMQEKIFSLKAAIPQKVHVDLKTEILCSQESILRLQQLMRMPTQTEAREKELQNLERLQKQLRSQFNDKSLILTETRKELFKLQGTLTVLEKENELHKVEKELKDTYPLEQALMEAGQEIDRLQEEVTSLEGLVSHVLSQ